MDKRPPSTTFDNTSIETDTGRTVIALSGIEAEAAPLSDDEIRRIQALEKDLGLTLVAVG
jgi:hypothetical protein